MQIRAGYELVYQFPKPTPMILALNIHHSRAADLLRPDLAPEHRRLPRKQRKRNRE